MGLQFSGTLTPADNRRSIPCVFEVPEGVTELHIHFDFAPRHTEGQPYAQQISLSIADPNGPRGEFSRPNAGGVHISEARATFGSLPGSIPAGQWIVYIKSHRIQPPTPVQYQLDVDWSFEPVGEPAQEGQPGQPAPRGAGWYRGDLHAHSFHSDGSWDVPELVEFMRGRGLDFVTLSDHNTIAGLSHHHSLADDGLVTLGGIELSTFYGHALALGVDRWYDWHVGADDILTMPQLAETVTNGGAFFVIAHPMAVGDPECCGCHWEHEDMMPGNAPAVEVWNGYWANYNEQGLQLYYRWLNQGHRLVATSGTDIHSRPPQDSRGRAAANVVYAPEFSEAGILDGLRRGHSYISASPELLLNAQTASGEQGMMGDTLAEDSAVTVAARWRGAQDGHTVRLIADGKVRETVDAQGEGEKVWTIPAGEAKWCTLELRDPQGGLWAVTNPIFFGAAQPVNR